VRVENRYEPLVWRGRLLRPFSANEWGAMLHAIPNSLAECDLNDYDRRARAFSLFPATQAGQQ